MGTIHVNIDGELKKDNKTGEWVGPSSCGRKKVACVENLVAQDEVILVKKFDVTPQLNRVNCKACIEKNPELFEQTPAKKVNPVLEASSIEDKLAATVTSYAPAELQLERIVKATLIQLASKETDKEAKIKNIGDFQVTVRIAETGSKKGTSAKDNDVLGHYCPAGTKNGEVKVGDMAGRDLVVNIWKVYGMTAEDFFEVGAHEAIHLYSDLIATEWKERDCNKAGGHRAFTTNGDFSFEGLNNQLGWLELVDIGGTYKFTTRIGKEGKKVCKEMGITAPNMGKIPAKKKAAPKRINIMCEGCGYKVNVPTGRYDAGEVDMYCNIHERDMERVD